MATPTGIVAVVRDGEIIDTLFEMAVTERPKFRYFENSNWAIDSAADAIAKLRTMTVKREHRGGSALQMFIDDGDVLINATIAPGSIRVHVAAISEEVAQRLFKRLDRAKRIPLTDEVQVNFWTVKDRYTRKIAISKWDDIRLNYPGTGAKSSAVGLERLFKDYRPETAGQLILWHGEPGTGKTTALRALGWEWRDWCSLSYIVDPEQFFGGSADYMLSVLLSSGRRAPWQVGEEEENIDITDTTAEAALVAKRNAKREQWQLLICEDTGELLASDAKERSGQGLSRLLNIVDGMIGQGLRVMVLVTTNETVDKLHPAVARPGRAGSIVEFGRFTQMEAKQWLSERGMPQYVVPQKGLTLAELYSILENRARVTESRPFGFAA